MTQLSLFPQDAYSIKRNSKGAFYPFSVCFYGEEVIYFMGLDLCCKYIRQKLTAQNMPYKEKERIVDKILEDFRIKDDHLSDQERAKRAENRQNARAINKC